MPAGSGKTELIVRIAAQLTGTDLPCLILTHTHAGVDALRQRLHRYSVSSDSAVIKTIDAWCFELISAYPILAEYRAPQDPDWSCSGEYHLAGYQLLKAMPIRRMIANSFGFAVVDEYQDCLVEQHLLIRRLASVLPTLVLGDPLQSLFWFGSNQPVCWDTDVLPQYSPIDQPHVPWRWNATNPELGEWLLSIRRQLEREVPIDLTSAPVRWHRLPREYPQRNWVVQRALDLSTYDPGSVVALGKFRRDCAQAAALLQGSMQVMEELEGKEILRLAQMLDTTDGAHAASQVIQICRRCATGVPAILPLRVSKRLEEGLTITTRDVTLKSLFESLNRVLLTPSARNIREAIEHIIKVSGVRIYCAEAVHELIRALKDTETDPSLSIKRAVVSRRNQLRQFGRAPRQFSISRPLLVKGLEFDHAVLLDADAYCAEELYVALTRGSKSVTILSESQLLTPTRAKAFARRIR